MNRKTSRTRTGGVTIADVARESGFSPMTVSRVINGESSVRAATRQIVERVIEQLDYSPNRAAQTLAGAEQIRIGLLYSNPSAAYLSEFLVGSLEQARVSHVQLVLEKCEPDQHEHEVAAEMIRSGLHGLVLPPPLCDSPLIHQAIEQAGALAVAVASARPPEGLSVVRIDDFAAAAAMTRHLIALGHRRIGFISGNPNQTASERRQEGYLTALGEAGIAFDPGLVTPGLFTYRSGLVAAGALLDLDNRPTAIFASNDDMAAATIAVAHQRHLAVPGDVTVCGFDDSEFARSIWPELTTIRQPIAEMSRAAVELLVGKIMARRSGKVSPSRDMVFDFALVRRDSDSAPR